MTTKVSSTNLFHRLGGWCGTEGFGFKIFNVGIGYYGA